MGKTTFPAKSLMMMPAIMYQAARAQIIKSMAAAVLSSGQQKCSSTNKMKPNSSVPNVKDMALWTRNEATNMMAVYIEIVTARRCYLFFV